MGRELQIVRQIEVLNLEDIHPNPENARTHSKRQIKLLAKGIAAHGFNVPLLIDKAGLLIAGHGRLEALKFLGRSEAPVIRLEHLTPEEAKAFAIADNRLGDLSEFDDRQLALTLKSLADLNLDFDLETTGFTVGEIDLKIEGLDQPEEASFDPADDPPPSGPPVCKLGDLWVLGEHRIFCGDALDPESYAALLEGALVDGAFVDGPYNVPIHGHVRGKGRKRQFREFAEAVGEMDGPEFTAFLSEACRLAALHSRDGAVQFWCMDWRHLRHLLAAGGGAFDELLNICVWNKGRGGMGALYRSAHEMIAVFRKGRTQHRNNVELGRNGRYRTNVWSYPGVLSFLRSGEEADLIAQHPTPKPVAMVADALLDVTARGDLVLDSFLGSGSSLMACERIGRRCRGIELDPLYVDLAIRRWRRMTGEDAVRACDGALFTALEEAA